MSELAERSKKLLEKLMDIGMEYRDGDLSLDACVNLKQHTVEQALLAERRLVWKQAEEMVLGMTRPTELSDRVERHVQAECDKCQSFVTAANALHAAAASEDLCEPKSSS